MAVVGSYGVGMTMFVGRFPGPGETLSGGRFGAAHGGKGSNQAIGARRLGAQVAFLTAVGDDEFGRTARLLWEEEGVDASHVVTREAATMVGVIIVDASGENRIVIAPGALDLLTVSDVERFESEIATADLLLVSLEIPVEVAVAALRIGAQVGTTTVLNPAPAAALPVEVWGSVDVVTPNQSEATTLLGSDEGLDGVKTAARLHARTDVDVVMTLGGDGAIVVTGQGTPEIVPAFDPGPVVDTTGAGDSFNAALATGLAERMGLRDAVRFACAAGAHAVGVAEVVPALPHRRDLERFL